MLSFARITAGPQVERRATSARETASRMARDPRRAGYPG